MAQLATEDFFEDIVKLVGTIPLEDDVIDSHRARAWVPLAYALYYRASDYGAEPFDGIKAALDVLDINDPRDTDGWPKRLSHIWARKI